MAKFYIIMLGLVLFSLFVGRLCVIESSIIKSSDVDFSNGTKERCNGNPDGICVDPQYMEDVGDCETINDKCTSKNNANSNCQFIENTDKSLILCIDVDKIRDVPTIFEHILHNPSSSCFIPKNEIKPIYDIYCKQLNGECNKQTVQCEFSEQTDKILKEIQHEYIVAKTHALKHNILLAFDGTGSEQQFERDIINDPQSDGQKWKSEIGIIPSDRDKKWIWRSHVANFWEDYEGESYYWYGPKYNVLFAAGKECIESAKKGHKKACDFIEKLLNDDDTDDSYFIDIIGFSRGGYIAMEVSRKLQFDGCKIKVNNIDKHIKSINVRWMGLYDPVRRVAEFKNIDIPWIHETKYDIDQIAPTVQNVSIAERSRKIKSRNYFGYATKGGCENKEKNTCIKNEFDNTSHGGVGGSPGSGDCKDDCSDKFFSSLCWVCSDDYTVDKDKWASVYVDMWMRQTAADNNVPIRTTNEIYYVHKDKPFVPYK